MPQSSSELQEKRLRLLQLRKEQLEEKQRYAAPDVTSSNQPRLTEDVGVVDPSRGVQNLTSLPRALMIRAGIAAEPTVLGKMDILLTHGLQPEISPTGQLVIKDPDDPNVLIPIDASDPELSDLAAMGPEILRMGIEMIGDYKLMKGGSGITAAMRTGALPFLARAGTAGAYGAAGGAALNAISLLAGGQRSLSSKEKLSRALNEMGLGFLGNALGFTAAEGLGRVTRGTVQGVLSKKPMSGAERMGVESQREMIEQGIPGEALMTARPSLLNLARGSSRFDAVRLNLQDALDKNINELWLPLEKVKVYPKLQGTIDQLEKTIIVEQSPRMGIPAFDALQRAAGTRSAKSLGRIEVGAITDESLKKFTDGISSKFGPIYERIEKVTGTTKKKFPQTTMEISELIPLLEGNTTVLANYLRKRVAPRFEPQVKMGPELLGPQGSPLPRSRTVIDKELTYSEAKRLWTDLGDQIHWNQVWGGQEDYVAAKIYQAMKKDGSSLAESVAPELKDLIQKTNGEYAEVMTFLENPLIGNIKKTTEGSRIGSQVFRSPENVEVMKRIIKNPNQRQDIALAHTRSLLGISDADPIGLINTKTVMGKIKKAKETQVWDAIFNDENGVFSKAVGDEIEGLIEGIGLEQSRYAARKKFSELITDQVTPNPAMAAQQAQKIRQEIGKAVRKDPEAFTSDELNILKTLLSDIETESGAQAIKSKFTGLRMASTNEKVGGVITADPTKLITNIKAFIDKLPQDEYFVLANGAQFDYESLFARFLSPEEVMQFNRVNRLANAAERIDALSNQMDFIETHLQRGTPSEANVPVGALQWKAFLAKLRKSFLATPVSMILIPKNVTGKRSLPSFGIQDFLQRGAMRQLRNPEKRQLEFGLRQLGRFDDFNTMDNPRE